MSNKRHHSRDTKRLRGYYGKALKEGSSSKGSIFSHQFDDGLSYEFQFGPRAYFEYELSGASSPQDFEEYVLPGDYTEYEELESKPAAQAGIVQGATAMSFPYIESFDEDAPRVENDGGKPCSCGGHSEVVEAPPQKEPPAAPEPAARTQEPQAQAPVSQSYFPDHSDDDFLSDMQAILTGKKRYDKGTQQAIPTRGDSGRAVSQQEEQPLAPLEAKSEHAIFDKIAKSMRYANAYDLGAMELEQRFNEFDRAAEAFAKPSKAGENAKGEAPSAGTAEFLNDLDEVRQASSHRLSIPTHPEAEEAVAEPMQAFLPAGTIANTLWWSENLAAKRYFQDEPQGNIDQFTLPPTLDQDQFFQAFIAAHPLHANDIIGDRTQAVRAQYFVVHDRGDNVHIEAPQRVADINRSARGVHLYIGFQRVLRVNDWHEAGDGTGLERRPNTCFVHVELTQHRRGLEEITDNGVLVKARDTRFTLWQYDMLAYAYLSASIRRGRFLTVTIHREVDRALQGGHDDPRDFDASYFYQRINALLGFGAESGFTYGIQQTRVMALRQVNMGGYVNEFLPYAAGTAHAANQYGAPRRNPDGSWTHHTQPASGPVCGDGHLLNEPT